MKMKAIVQEVYGGPEVLKFDDIPKPKPNPKDLLVKVMAISVNPVDTKVRQRGEPGSSVPNPPLILGWDAAGTVEAAGDEVENFKVGDAVYFAGDIGRPGSCAEYCRVEERRAGEKPSRLSFEEAAAIPLTALTGWEGLIESMSADQAEPGARTLLLIGGAGGVGSITIQIARQVCGLQVIATASREESIAFCREMGADHVINHKNSLLPQMRELGFDGADFIFSCWELNNFSQLAKCLNPLGHICFILAGEASKSMDLSGLFTIRGSVSFEFMFTRPRSGRSPEKQGEILNRVSQLLDDGILKTTMTEKFSLSEVQKVHRRIESRHTRGKLVMVVD
jgi:zinc-binding alcohol dehydrogenase family protein